MNYETIINNYIGYLIVFKILIIIAGILSIFWGYKLFSILNVVKTIVPQKGESLGTTEGAVTFGDFSLTIKNAAPGTCFAIFGATILSLMIIYGSPNLVWNQLKSTMDETKVPTGHSPLFHIELKSSKDNFQYLFDKAQVNEKNEQYKTASYFYLETLFLKNENIKSKAKSLNAIAWILFKTQNVDTAIEISKASINMDNKNGLFYDTLANCYLASDKYKLALEEAKKAYSFLPNDPFIILTLAIAYKKTGDTTNFNQFKDELLSKNPSLKNDLEKRLE